MIDEQKSAPAWLEQPAGLGRIRYLLSLESSAFIGDDESDAVGAEFSDDMNGLPRIALIAMLITYAGEFIYAGACHRKLRVGSVNVPVDEPSHLPDQITAAFNRAVAALAVTRESWSITSYEARCARRTQ